ncbi:hypothetical protein B0H10DRAFT_151271 [Mycena sp. CBHHK59/15]|nr:hypothetical protein B0H10DRAFT_151271 [Mycena sp. CBHHK59/15]
MLAIYVVFGRGSALSLDRWWRVSASAVIACAPIFDHRLLSASRRRSALCNFNFLGAVACRLPCDPAQVVVPVAAGIAGAALGAAATALLAVPVLGLAGFSSIGPVAGTLAASIQASIGSVAAGSSFAAAQSIAMGGMAVPPLAIALGSIAIGVAIYFGTRALMKYLKKRKERKEAEERAKKGKRD